MKTLDIMLDLETLGLGNAPVINQISAVACNLETGETFEEFNRIVSPQSCVKLGMTITGTTVEWWLKQEPNVVARVFTDSLIIGIEIGTALKEFSEFIAKVKKDHEVTDVRVWGNGLLADNKWIESAYELAKIPAPFKYWESSDVRTLVDLGIRLYDFDPKKDAVFVGEKHNAIDDCKHQIKYCSDIYKKIAGGK